MKGSEFYGENDFSKLRKKAEKKIKIKSLSESEHELHVHKEELEMQTDELRLTQSKLLISLEEYKQLFNFAPVGYFVLDKNGNILNLNCTAANLVGLEINQLKGKPFSLILNGKSFQDDYYRYRNHILETEIPQHIESEILKKNKKIISILIESTIVKNEKNNFKYLLTTVFDISDQKEQELKLKKALIKEQELNNMKSRFVSMASHEFRTPLATIQSSAYIIGKHIKSNNTTKSTKHINRIISSINHLTEILNDFLSLDKLEQGVYKIEKVNVNIKKLIAEIVNEVNLILKKGQNIKYILKGKSEFMIDPKILQIILLNLLSNASKYSDEGKTIEFNVKVTKDKLSINVKDDGIGIPQSEKDKIFTSFYRATNAEMIGGTGLGLNILKKQIELIGGEICFVSEENVGSTFSVEIPS